MTDKIISDLTAVSGQPNIGNALFETEYGGASRKLTGPQLRSWGECTKPVASSFGTTVDHVTSSNAMTITDTDDGIALLKSNTAIGNTNRWGMILKSIPAAPKVLEAVIERRHHFQNFHTSGMVLRESGTGIVVNFGFTNDGNRFTVAKWTSDGDSFNSTLLDTVEQFHTVRVRITLASTPTIKYSLSLDGGLSWIDFFIHAPTAAFTSAPNQGLSSISGSQTTVIVSPLPNGLVMAIVSIRRCWTQSSSSILFEFASPSQRHQRSNTHSRSMEV
jgi:hypothetical protein